MINWRQFENKSTLELIQLIGDKTDLINSEAAFHAFYFRFSQDVSKKCEIICGKWGYDHLFASEVMQNVFRKFWKYPKYKHEKSNCKDIDKGVLLYLFRFAFTCLIDQIKIENSIGISPYTGDEEIITEIPHQIEIPGEYQVIITNAISSFSPKHKIVYLTYKMYEIDGFKLPRTLLLKLRQELGISQTTIRYYKYEVEKKIKEHLELWKESKGK